MTDSILNSTKKILGIAEDYDVFDLDILTHINSVLSTLTQLGIGPEAGFEIEDATTTWDTFLGIDPKYNFVKSFVFLKVRMLFDPPQTSYLLTALEKQAAEYEWRIRSLREETGWTPPEE